ncbi:44898_t:CDS:2 [Gigaspora margarita]|uniref:44898_t:CDS:1 n=1 Tax=Gigaspora margarita TaxID=4874 RepID=A0ABM8W458_GIGMA|nr:44898_t:CDS:2 [Gigaspora margarita]
MFGKTMPNSEIQARLVEKDTLEDQISVVGRMQVVNALNCWQHKIGLSPVVIDWLRNGVPIYPRGMLVLAAKPVPNQYNLSVDQQEWVRKELDRLIKSAVIGCLGVRYSKGTGYGSEEQGDRSKRVDVRVGRKREDLSSQVSFSGGKDTKIQAWTVYKGYCEIMGLTALPSEVDTLVSFLVWLDLAHSFSEYVDFLAAVSREHLECHFSDPSKDYRVKIICKALVKEYKKDKEPRWPRDPLTVSALR